MKGWRPSTWGDEIRSRVIQNQTLAALRDTLLPKLLSGELCGSEIPMEHAK
jgi:hypothetical protein